jgi:hypothetical protein
MNKIELDSCPPAGTGVHTWIMSSACRCKRLGVGEQEAEALIEEQMSRAPKPSNEVSQAVQKAYHLDSTGFRSAPKWPARDAIRIRNIISRGLTAPGLAKASPNPLPEHCGAQVLPLLFPGDPLICLGRNEKDARVKRVSEWCAMDNLQKHQLIVPSPMLGLRGLTAPPKSHFSPRAKSNVGIRKWLVVECDFSPEDIEEYGANSALDLCAAVIGDLAETRPLIMVVFSGNKSLHAWFPVDPDEEESEVIRFMSQAVSCGADSKTWTVNQYVRLPGGTRDSGAVQRVIYFDEEAARQWA